MFQKGRSGQQGQVFKGVKKDEAWEEAIRFENHEVICGLCQSSFYELIGHELECYQL